MKRIARVFPRRTKATPTDDLTFVGPPGLFPPEVDEVHISVAFTWDLPRAEWLAKQWKDIAPVRIGGPATGMRGEAFTPGMYLKHGHVITSRGCPNRCWFCEVPDREGIIRELPITDGWNVLDDNLLACSDGHVQRVFNMLHLQPKRAEFTGGFEALRLKSWHVTELRKLKPKSIFFAYDTPNDWIPLVTAIERLRRFGFDRHVLRCYVLIGFPKDDFESADKRLSAVKQIGCDPMAMLWRDYTGKRDPKWSRFQRQWARPAIIHRVGAR